jgi:hypothetical protein
LGSPVNPLTGYEDLGRDLAITVLGLLPPPADPDQQYPVTSNNQP